MTSRAQRPDHTASSPPTPEPNVVVPNNTHPQWWKDPGMRRLNFLLLTCYLGAIANGYASSLISSLLTNPRWLADLPGLSNVTLLGLVVAAHPLGCIAAFLPAPWLSDTFGRRAGILFGNVCMTAAVLGQVFCRTAAQFLGLRLVAGFASIFNTISSAALLLELAHPRQRAVAGALFNTFFFVGSMAAAWTAYGALRLASSWSWRLPVAVQMCFTVAQLVLLVSCPESPRWYAMNKNAAQAKVVLEKFHANGHTDDALVQVELSEMCAPTELEHHSRNTGWTALISTPGNRKRLVLSVAIGVATQWVGNGVITFYLAPVLRTVGITSAFRQQGINGGLQIYNWILACSAALLAERAGRRRLFLASAGTMLLFMALVTACSATYAATRSVAAGYAVVVFLFLFLGGYVIGLTPIPILYVNEIWPSALRAKGTSVFWVAQAGATCFNQYVNPIALQRMVWRYYLVYVGVLVAVGVFMFFCVPETKGLSLEEVSGIFDRKEEVDDVVLHGIGSRDRDRASRVSV
ncbi:general substrate transporter [Massariosphaeria phaeospora]|uniref:General substrate transporter n=1 Tax=Massariosphaeria phaeospora TaxID=100035 RepID=A0A7C8I5G4_9PLEO|nr:general substrate transporter [Massariosphaeria phaeospora]